MGYFEKKERLKAQTAVKVKRFFFKKKNKKKENQGRKE